MDFTCKEDMIDYIRNNYSKRTCSKSEFASTLGLSIKELKKILYDNNIVVIKGYKYRLYPTQEQKIQFAKTFGCCRFVYNHMLAKKIDKYKANEKQLSKTDCNNMCNRELKEEFAWLKDVDKFALTNAIYDLDSAYQNFFRELKKGNSKQGLPRFKSKKGNHRAYTTNFTNNNIRVDFDNNKIQLPKVQWVDAKVHREFDGDIVSATVSMVPSGKYFVSITVETEHKILEKNTNSVGLDLGIKDIAICSDGTVFDNQKFTYMYEKKLAKLQRELAKKEKFSKNWNKQRIKIARIHEKIANKRRNRNHEISATIVKENQFIFSEDLNVSGMLKNSKLAKSVSDCGWYELTRQLEYKSIWNERVYAKIDRFYPSSQLCSECGYKNPDTKGLDGLRVRFWTCPDCGANHDRDANASINILNEGLRQTIA